MSKRIAVEVKIVEFFRTAPIDTASSVLEICKATVKERTSTPAPVRRRRTRKVLSTTPTITVSE